MGAEVSGGAVLAEIKLAIECKCERQARTRPVMHWKSEQKMFYMFDNPQHCL